MAQVSVLEGRLQLKSSPEKLYNFFKSQNKHIPNSVHAENVHGVAIHEGDWGTPGSVTLWKYSLEGKEETFKDRIELDEVNKTITHVAVGGSVLELYKSYKAILKIETGTLKFRIEYEKLNGDTPPPNKYLQFLTNVIKDVDANLVKG